MSEYLFFGLVEFKNDHKQPTFIGQPRCELSSGYLARVVRHKPNSNNHR